jgi:tetratricopeptide (TPR) repeat protein
MKLRFSLFSAAIAIAIGLGMGAEGCGPGLDEAPPKTLADLRGDAKDSTDKEVLGDWLFAEMVAPGGDAQKAALARGKLGTDGGGMHANVARGLYDEIHGEPAKAADAYVNALAAASISPEPEARLYGWFTTHHLLGLRGQVTGLYKRHAGTLAQLVESPRNIGWRAAAELFDWSISDAYEHADITGDAYETLMAQRMGCATEVRIAGPFGHGVTADRRRSFAAERTPWPIAWSRDPLRNSVPHVLPTKRHGCMVASTERVEDGIFYAETFVDVQGQRDVIIAAQGSIDVWVDDQKVGHRDTRDWGSWQKFGSAVRLGAGRHRILANTTQDAMQIRILNMDGTASKLTTSTEDRGAYGLSEMAALADPNAIEPYVHAREAKTPQIAAVTSYLASIEGLADVANVLIEPYVSKEDAAPLALELAASYTHVDPIYSEETRRKLERELHERALKRDPKLWYPAAWLTLDQADQKGLVDMVEPIRKLAAQFPNAPALKEELASIYARLGWRAERMQALEELARTFPDDTGALHAYLTALDEDGSVEQADVVAARIMKLDPDSEIRLDRAIARRAWKDAIDELRRLEKRRPERKDIAARIADVLARSGDPTASANELEKALAKNPADSAARFRIADRAYAKGDLSALRRALAEAIQTGGKTGELRGAVELIEGASALEPYRIDGKKTIDDFAAWEKTGKHMDGIAARVLDYSALMVHEDGSSEMLEHEIMRIQSQEAIGKESEQKRPDGLVLRFRVVKPDGRVLEPQEVAGKPTMTMPHLEVGDYIEIEHITPTPSDSLHGRTYRGPTWFFREPDKGYWRSEFITITPKDKPLQIETRGSVPPPKVTEKQTFTERRWRVDESPPAPEEPDPVPANEFLPSVRIGWGNSLEDTLVRYVDLTTDEIPIDPRMVKRAQDLFGKIPTAEGRVRAAYKFVMDNVEDGNENDGRRVITGKSGSKQSGFYHFLRLLDVPVQFGIAKNKLALSPIGPMSESESFDSVVLRVAIPEGAGGPKGSFDAAPEVRPPARATVRYLTIRDKFAPYGYVPAELRGQPVTILVPGTPRETIPSEGALDGVTFEGRADMRPDGSAEVTLSSTYTGKLAIGMRTIFARVPETQRDDFVETRLLGRNVPGAKLRKLELIALEDVTQPFVVKMKAEVPQLVRVEEGRRLLKSLFPLRLAELATLPKRQTPMLLGSPSHVEVHFEVVVPESVTMPVSLPQGEAKHADRIVSVKDAVHGHAITLNRLVDIPAGRVMPGDDYASFVTFVRKSDALLESDIAIGK